MFSGSYDPEDCVFLLKPVRLAPTPLEEKERLIQSGRRHYSEMIGAEALPSAQYLAVFHQALARVKTRFARHLLTLAGEIARLQAPHPGLSPGERGEAWGPHPARAPERRGGNADEIVLVSLARAGTPIGVMLGRILRRLMRRRVRHYSISIIRDRGIDEAALAYILDRHAPSALVFVDGWTGKGAIAAELQKSVAQFNEQHHVNLDEGLCAVADLSGTAALAATAEDYLIPSAVLGCTISGLVSRSILNSDVVRPGEFHGCVMYEEYRAHDLSRWFVDALTEESARLYRPGDDPAVAPGVSARERQAVREKSVAFLQATAARFRIRDVNRIKPGLGEATRVLLRRVPDCLLLRDPDLADVAHVHLLAQEKQVPIVVDDALPYLAVAIIKEFAE